MKKFIANDQIRCDKVSVIDSSGNQAGVLNIRAAKELAKYEGLDLILLDANQNPPVCRIADLGKFIYQRNKKSEGKTKKVMVKEIQLRPTTGEHDLEVKTKQICGFLEDGHRVKLVMKFSGREASHREVSAPVWDYIRKGIEQVGHFEREPKVEGWAAMNTMVLPGRLVAKAKANDRGQLANSAVNYAANSTPTILSVAPAAPAVKAPKP